jgi:hypothetical protein
MYRRIASAVATLLLLCFLSTPALLAQTTDPPADGGGQEQAPVFNIDFGGLLDPLRQIRDQALNWKADFNEQMNLWLASAVTYVGDRIGEAIAQQGQHLLDRLTSTSAVTETLYKIPEAWTYQNPVVWALWASMTGIFVAFLGPVVGYVWLQFQHRRRHGATADHLVEQAQFTLLGLTGALTSPAWATLGIIVANITTELIVSQNQVLPGLPQARDADAGLRNGVLLLVYAILAFLIWLQRLGEIATVMIALVFSGWGIGSLFWAGFGAWYRVWRGLYVTALASSVMQVVLFRLGGETINLALTSLGDSDEAVFVGICLGLACLGTCLFTPVLVAGAYASGAFPNLAGQVNRAGATLTGVNVGQVLSSATGGGASRAGGGAG